MKFCKTINRNLRSTCNFFIAFDAFVLMLGGVAFAFFAVSYGVHLSFTLGQCLFPTLFLPIIGLEVSAMMPLVIAFDRFIRAYFPFWYNILQFLALFRFKTKNKDKLRLKVAIGRIELATQMEIYWLTSFHCIFARHCNIFIVRSNGLWKRGTKSVGPIRINIKICQPV